jgi:hypothetical protein
MDQLSHHVDIHIENLNVHDPVLENLTFRLDKLDIKELSGALNMGNNFGVEVKEKPKSKEKIKKKSKDEIVIKEKMSDDHPDIKEKKEKSIGSKKEKKVFIDEKDKNASMEKKSSGYTFKFGQKKN